MVNYLSKGLKGVFFIFVLTFLSSVFGYVIRTMLARNLEVSQFGLFYSVYSLMMFLTLFSLAGFSVTLVKYISEYKAKKEYEKLTFSITFTAIITSSLSIIISIILFFSSDFLAVNYFRDMESVLVIRLFSIALIGMTLMHILISIFRGLQDFLFAGLISFFEKFVFAILVVLFILLGFPNNTYLPSYALVIAVFITLPLFSFKLLKYKRYLKKIRFFPDVAKKMRGFAFASFLAALGILIIGYIDTLMITYFRSLEEVGIYNVVLPTVMVLGIFTNAIRQVLAPMVTELWTKKLKKRLNNGIAVLRNYSLVSIVPMVLVLFVFPKIIINLLFGDRYIGGYLAMQILSVGVLFFTIGFIDLTIMRYIGKPKESAKIVLIGVLFNIIANLILIPIFGINGAAITTTLSYFLMMVLSYVKLREFIGVRSGLLFWFKLIFAALIFTVTVMVLKTLLHINQFLEAAICLAAAALVYVVICYLLKIVKIDEVRLFLKSLVLRGSRK